MKRSFWLTAAFITGLLPGFFLVFNFMFSDIISLNERILSILVVIVAYLVLGTAFGLTGHGMEWKYGICLSIPAVILAVIYSIRETGTIAMNLLYAAAAIGASAAGTSLGSSLTRKKR